MKANKNQNEQAQALASMSEAFEIAGQFKVKNGGQPIGLTSGEGNPNALGKLLSQMPETEVKRIVSTANQWLGFNRPTQALSALANGIIITNTK